MKYKYPSPYVTREEKIPAESFVRLNFEERSKIESVKVLPPVLGDNSFGYLRLNYRNPRYDPNAVFRDI